MGKIFSIFKEDLQKIFKNKLALAMLIGLIFIPGIYAWLNIDSNWDPYDNTGNLKIAVVNKDEGTKLLDKEVNMGSSLVENLKTNDAMDWTFVDEENAKNGVDSGEYYGAIILPTGFSNNLTTLFDGDQIQKPSFDFYVNEKKNPVAPIIVNKAVGTIQTTLDQAFVNSIVYNIIDEVERSNIIDSVESATDTATAKLSQARDSIEQLRTTLDVVGTATDSTASALSAVRDLMPLVNDLSERTASTIQNTQNALNSFNTTYDQHSQKIKSALDEAKTLVENIKELIDSIEITSDSAIENPDISESAEDTDAIVDLLKAMVTDLEAELEKITNLYNNASGAIDNALAESIATASRSAEALNSISSAIAKGDVALAHTIDALNATTSFTKKTDTLLLNLESDLTEISKVIDNIKNNELFAKIINLLKNSPEDVADFISEPIATNEIDVYPVANYGSKMAPFYTILAAWVGCTLLVAVLKTDIEEDEKRKDIKPYQAFFGRFLLFGMFAMAQGLVIGLGDIVMQVQVINYPLFLLTTMLSSFVFMLIVYSLAISFGKVGAALAIVILVLQVAGSGGTFPVELLPGFFQTLQPVMPFYPAMNALRETVAGFYQNAYLINILFLFCHTIIPLLLGLVIRKPIIKLKHMIKHKVEEADIIA